jgi:hypothetical protein
MAAAKNGLAPNVIVVDVDADQALLMRASDEFAKSDLPLEERRALVKAVADAMRSRGEAVTFMTIAECIGTTVEAVRRYLSIDELPTAVQELTETPLPTEKKSTNGEKPSKPLPNSTGGVRAPRANDDRILSAKAAERLVAAKRGGVLTDVDLEHLATKMKKGVLSASTRGIDEIISFLKDASAEGRRALIQHGTATLEKAREVDKNAKRKAEQAKRDQETGGNSANAVFRQVTENLKRWAIYIHGIRKSIEYVPEGQREGLVKYLEQLRDGVDSCLVELGQGPGAHAGEAPPAEVIDLLEGQYRIVTIRGEVG